MVRVVVLKKTKTREWIKWRIKRQYCCLFKINITWYITLLVLMPLMFVLIVCTRAGLNLNFVFRLLFTKYTSHAALLQRPIGATRKQRIPAKRRWHDTGCMIFEDLILLSESIQFNDSPDGRGCSLASVVTSWPSATVNRRMEPSTQPAHTSSSSIESDNVFT